MLVCAVTRTRTNILVSQTTLWFMPIGRGLRQIKWHVRSEEKVDVYGQLGSKGVYLNQKHPK